jgi:hypothetical protein
MASNDVAAPKLLQPFAAVLSLATGLSADAVSVACVIADLGAGPLSALLPPHLANQVLAVCLIVSAVSKAHLANARSISKSVDNPT